MTAIENIFIKCEHEIDVTLQKICDYLGVDDTVDVEEAREGDKRAFAGDSWMILEASKVLGPRRNVTQFLFGFEATYGISVTVLSELNREAVQDRMIGASIKLVKDEKWTLGLVFHNLEIQILSHNTGKTIAYNYHDVWNEKRLQLLDIPYEVAT